MKLEILIGMIASGKSTYARKRAREGAMVVCHDDLTAMLHAEYRYEPELRDCYRGMEESLAWAALNAGRDVIIDRTHLTRESRQRWINWAISFDAMQRFDGKGPKTEVVAVVFPVESAERHATRRLYDDARGRSYADWVSVALHHEQQRLAEPLQWQAEGFSGIVTS